MTRPLDHVRSALFLPASNARALAKARTLACDLVILDIEDAVMEADKDAARAAVVAAAGEDWVGRLLAARAAGIVAFDGVYNRLDDAEGFAADAQAGRAAGYDGKSLIHPSQIDPANRIFGATEAEAEEARALIEAFSGGAERFRGRMIEAMHVATAHRILGRA